MKNVLCFGVVCTFCALAPQFTFAQSTGKECKVSEHGQVFKSVDGGLTVELAVCQGKNDDGLQDALIRITGAPAEEEGINKKVIFHKAEHAGTGYDFIANKDGKDFHRMMTRESWGSWKNFDLYVDQKSYKIYPDLKETKKFKTSQLAADYKAGK